MSDMTYQRIGRSGLTVSRLGLGGMTFGRETQEDVCAQMLDAFADAGGNFIDTADAYGGGASEEIIGRWLRGKRRDDLVIATKLRFGVESGPNKTGLGRKHMVSAVEASLRRLATDYVDLYQLHMWDSETVLEETVSSLDVLVRSGKVRYVGVSNFSGWQLQKAIDLSLLKGYAPAISVQALYNLIDRETEWELIPLAEAESLGVISWSPLRGGWLSGKFRRGMEAPAPGTRIENAGEHAGSETWTIYNNERTWQIVDAMYEISGETGRTPAQVALAWVLQRPAVTALILGGRNLRQLAENLGAVGWELGADQMQRLNAASSARLPYPYNFHTGSWYSAA